MRIDLPEKLAHWTVSRRWVLVGAAVFLLAMAFGAVLSRPLFDTDILNLLPGDSRAVDGLRIYNEKFTPARELAFVLQSPNDSELSVEYSAEFIETLRTAPWAQRVLDGPPTESAAGKISLPDLIFPLLTNLSPEEFRTLLGNLSPEDLRSRLERLTAQMQSGSVAARLELESDPLGLAAPAVAPVWNSMSLSSTFDLTSPDERTRIFPVISNQADLGADTCRELMAEVHAMIRNLQNTWQDAAAPRIYVTGRAAYVDEISRSMERDIQITSIVSLLVVAGLFWLGFRSFLPLLGSVVILAFSGFLALAGGLWIFDGLNVIAIGFCSILFGLGDDFTLLLYQAYRSARERALSHGEAIAAAIRSAGPSILAVTVTTCLGFLALNFSGSKGFAQLGTLVSLGLVLCVASIFVWFFLFVREARELPPDPALRLSHRLIVWIQRRRKPVLLGSGLLFVVCWILLVLPWRPLSFDIRPTSLEPKNIPAARALDLIVREFPASFEPVLLITPSDISLLDSWQNLSKSLHDEALVDSGSSGLALALDSGRMNANHGWLLENTSALHALRKEFPSLLATNGLRPEAFASADDLLDKLISPRLPEARWDYFLAEDSVWWFLLDRFQSPDGHWTLTYLRPTESGASIAGRNRITELAEEHLPGVIVSGWSQTLASLIPWAERELKVFGGLVAAVILITLAAIYRSWRNWLIHLSAMIFSFVGLAATLKLLDLPINLLNVLAFPLILAVGVDFGTHLILAAKSPVDRARSLAEVFKPVVMSGLTTAAGFGALVLAMNPALSGFGLVCSVGVLWCLLVTAFWVLPMLLFEAESSSNRKA